MDVSIEEPGPPDEEARLSLSLGALGDSAESSREMTIPTSIEQLFEGGGAASHARPARLNGRERGSQPGETIRGLR